MIDALVEESGKTTSHLEALQEAGTQLHSESEPVIFSEDGIEEDTQGSGTCGKPLHKPCAPSSQAENSNLIHLWQWEGLWPKTPK